MCFASGEVEPLNNQNRFHVITCHVFSIKLSTFFCNSRARADCKIIIALLKIHTEQREQSFRVFHSLRKTKCDIEARPFIRKMPSISKSKSLPSRPYSRRARCDADSWTWEILSCIFSIIATLTVAALCYIYDDNPLPRLPFGIGVCNIHMLSM